MNQEIFLRLQEIGFSDKEARVYAAMLTLGPQGVQEIAEQADVPRSTLYAVLASLTERGLVSQYDQDKRTVYTAEAPKKLLDLIAREVDALRSRQDTIATFIPALEALFRAQPNKPVVRFYEGSEGLRSLRDHLSERMTDHHDVFIRLEPHIVRAGMEDQERRHRMLRYARRTRLLYVPDAGIPIPPLPDWFKPPLHEVRFSHTIPFAFEGEFGAYDRLVYLVTGNPRLMACLIESESFAGLLRAMFEFAWAAGRPTREDAQGLAKNEPSETPVIFNTPFLRT
jgi:predicted transcriptional regulator